MNSYQLNEFELWVCEKGMLRERWNGIHIFLCIMFNIYDFIIDKLQYIF